MKIIQLLAGVALVFGACGTHPETESAATPVTTTTAPMNDVAHLPAPIAETYETHAANVPAGKDLAYDLALTFGGRERFRGRIRHDAATSRINMTRGADGASLRYDGTDVAVLPDTATWKGARFAVFTWPYFAAAPFKLADPGTQWETPRAYGWTNGQPAEGAKLTFAAGTGDAPDDYYVAFRDGAGRLDGLAYIVTYGKGADGKSSAEPHAIRYSDYRDVDGVPIAHRWDFYMWDEEAGLGEALGFADVTGPEWVTRDEASYVTSAGRLAPAPVPGD